MTLLMRLFTVALAAAVLMGALGSSTWSIQPALVLAGAVLTSLALVWRDARLRLPEVAADSCCQQADCATCVAQALSQPT